MDDISVATVWSARGHHSLVVAETQENIAENMDFGPAARHNRLMPDFGPTLLRILLYPAS